MAKFIKEYELHLNDLIEFKLPKCENGKINFQLITGRVQDISEFPDLMVEIGIPNTNSYNRYKISINMITNVFNKTEPWITEYSKFENNEPLEYVYNEDYKTTKIINYYN